MAKIPHIDPLDLIGAAPKLTKAQRAKIEQRADTLLMRNRKSREIAAITDHSNVPEMSWDDAYAQAMREFQESNK